MYNFPPVSVSKESLVSITLFWELTNFNTLCFKHYQLYLSHISTNHILLIGQNNLNMCLFLWTRSKRAWDKTKDGTRIGGVGEGCPNVIAVTIVGQNVLLQIFRHLGGIMILLSDSDTFDIFSIFHFLSTFMDHFILTTKFPHQHVHF